jgi:hypothetical protein
MTELEMLIKKNYEDYLKEHGLEGKARKHPTYETFEEIFTLGMVTQQAIDKLTTGEQPQ